MKTTCEIQKVFDKFSELLFHFLYVFTYIRLLLLLFLYNFILILKLKLFGYIKFVLNTTFGFAIRESN